MGELGQMGHSKCESGWWGPGNRRRKVFAELPLSNHLRLPTFSLPGRVQRICSAVGDHWGLLSPSCVPSGCHGDGSLPAPHLVMSLSSPRPLMVKLACPTGDPTPHTSPFLQKRAFRVLGNPFVGFVMNGELGGRWFSGVIALLMVFSWPERGHLHLRMTSGSTGQRSLVTECPSLFLMSLNCGK